MKFQPVTAVWEITMGCNMRCGHCGSSCEERLPDELSTDDVLSLADEIAELGLRWVTISGGEPLLREDLPLLVQKLVSRGVAVNIITNGWLIDEKIAHELKNAGISTVAISIDGTEEIHDSIRKQGSFARIRDAIFHLKNENVSVGAVTTVSNKNINILPLLRAELIKMGVDMWQVQLGQPMGNFKQRPDWVISPEQVPAIIEFCYETSLSGEIRIFPADCIGYYTEKEMFTRQMSGVGGHSAWNGCNAGVRSFGILHNGDILGCTSIREKSFIEGNVKKNSLAQIWNDENNFSWRRGMTKSQMHGDCAVCTYGARCLGGCPNTRLTMNGDINSENFYCTYNLILKKLRTRLKEENDDAWLTNEAEKILRANDFQTAAFFSARANEIAPKNIRALSIRGYAEFMCGNYSACEDANKKVLALNPNDTYAMKGLGIALHKQGDRARAIELVEQAAKLTNYQDADILNDLEYVKNVVS
jgi:radical SAM protein with 4Fe4S-binding SPASM domain